MKKLLIVILCCILLAGCSSWTEIKTAGSKKTDPSSTSEGDQSMDDQSKLFSIFGVPQMSIRRNEWNTSMRNRFRIILKYW